ncbi:hypothetical protein AUR64_16980 [Haloprofundus marisrubri]|uniref:Protein-glutamine gamma-glutamyltransferase-like C-terminal domain-containing protein n=1 Tax=Haloprofundus marisrubri TaxID=1514971 RepID=A0A0W1R7V1_9EURY|nr:hypothetical protein AUR64_16980 [Haloprofundus marisrubri]
MLAIAVAACCLFSLGTAAGTLDSSVQTDPDDVIDIDSSMLPVGADQLDELKQTLTDPSAGGGEGETKQQQQKKVQTQKQQQREQSVDQREEQLVNSDFSPDESGDQVPPEESLWEKLLAFLESLLPFAAIAGLLLVAWTYRDRLSAALRRWLPGDDDGTATAAEPVGDPNPQDEISAAWCEMLAAVGLERETKLTPRERGEKVVEQGEKGDSDAVWGLTSLYESVRYGGDEVTEERRECARNYLRRFRGNSGGDR